MECGTRAGTTALIACFRKPEKLSKIGTNITSARKSPNCMAESRVKCTLESGQVQFGLQEIIVTGMLLL